MARKRNTPARFLGRPKTELLHFRVTPEDRRALEKIAREHKVALSELLRGVLHVVAVAWDKDGPKIKSVAEQLGETIADAVKAAARE